MTLAPSVPRSVLTPQHISRCSPHAVWPPWRGPAVVSLQHQPFRSGQKPQLHTRAPRRFAQAISRHCGPMLCYIVSSACLWLRIAVLTVHLAASSALCCCQLPHLEALTHAHFFAADFATEQKGTSFAPHLITWEDPKAVKGRVAQVRACAVRRWRGWRNCVLCTLLLLNPDCARGPNAVL